MPLLRPVHPTRRQFLAAAGAAAASLTYTRATFASSQAPRPLRLALLSDTHIPADPSERYNAADTMKFAKTVFLTTGHGLYSGLGRRIFTIVADTCGRHDTIGGCCSAESNKLRYGVDDTPNCRDNFLKALGRFGLGRKDIVANLNFFMNVPVEADGSMAIVDGWSKPGDYVDLRAEMDALVAISNCPQIYNPCNGGKPTPIRLVTYDPAG